MNFKCGDYPKYESFIRETERRFSIPENMLALILFQASKYDADHIAGNGRNPIGSIGIANLTREDCATLWFGKDFRTDPKASIFGAAVLLRAQYNRFGGWRAAALAFHSDTASVLANLRRNQPLPPTAAKYVQEIQSQCRV